jgi:hypothetical protein
MTVSSSSEKIKNKKEMVTIALDGHLGCTAEHAWENSKKVHAKIKNRGVKSQSQQFDSCG